MIQVANTISKMTSTLSAFRASLPAHILLNEEVKLGDKKWADIEPHVRNYADKTGNSVKSTKYARLRQVLGLHLVCAKK